jgi:G3E family GTPase
MKKYRNIPTNIITGFLGVGKTTAIKTLLQTKPGSERWAVLVNEFGEVGIDGALMNADGIAVKEVAGGCMCCAVGLPSRTALNRLIKEQNPHRIIIEPTGLAHPKQVLDMFSGPEYDGVLDIRAVVCLIDPWSVTQETFLQLPAFQDQVSMADVLVATKADLASDEQLQVFKQFTEQLQPKKQVVAVIEQGKLLIRWLDLAHQKNEVVNVTHNHGHHRSSEPVGKTDQEADSEGVIRTESHTEFAHSCGWIFPKESVFQYDKLERCLCELSVPRVKGVFNTDKGWHSFNRMRDVVSNEVVAENNDSRVEMIDVKENNWLTIDLRLRDCRIKKWLC